MKKDNKLVKFTTLVLLVTMVAISLVSGTYAKYTAKATGSDTAKVAHWSIDVDGTDIAKEDEIEFNLFDTTITNDAGDKLIAPGSTGSFDSIIVTNNSEVDATYSIAYTISNESNVPLEFKVGEGEWTTDLTSLNVTDADLAVDASSADAATTVQWRWLFNAEEEANVETKDAADTALGTATEVPVVTVTATITATQAAN